MKSTLCRKSKKEVCSLIIGKTTGEMQRIIKQYNFKFVIIKYDNEITDISFLNKNNIIKLEIEKDIILRAE